MPTGPITDFENYDGTSAADTWGFEIPTTSAGQPSFGGLYAIDDATGNPLFSMVPGNNASLWAIASSNPMASGWGGGVGIWFGCLDVSAYTGLRMAVRGSTPSAEVTIAVATEDQESSDVVVLPSDTWTTIEVPFASLTPALDRTRIISIAVLAEMLYQDDDLGNQVPVPGAYEVLLDDLEFY